MTISLETFRLDNVIWVDFEARQSAPLLLVGRAALRRGRRYARCSGSARFTPHKIFHVRSKGVR